MGYLRGSGDERIRKELYATLSIEMEGALVKRPNLDDFVRSNLLGLQQGLGAARRGSLLVYI